MGLTLEEIEAGRREIVTSSLTLLPRTEAIRRMTLQLLEGLLCLVVGLVCLTQWRSYGARAYEFQRRRHFRTGPPMGAYQGMYLLGGVVFTAMGLLAMLGVVTFGR